MRQIVTIVVPHGYETVAELLEDCQLERASLSEAFELFIKALNYDGTDTNSLTVGEIRKALP